MSLTITRRDRAPNVLLFTATLLLGVAIGLWAGTLLNTGAPAGFTCGHYSPVTGACDVYINREELARYD